MSAHKLLSLAFNVVVCRSLRNWCTATCWSISSSQVSTSSNRSRSGFSGRFLFSWGKGTSISSCLARARKIGKTERSSTHFACRDFVGFDGFGMLSVDVSLFTAVSPTRRGPVRIGPPLPYVLRDTALQRLSHPPCNLFDLSQYVPGHRIQAANWRERWHVQSRRTPTKSPRAIAYSRPAVR